MRKKVGIWIRVSTEDQAQGESPQHHEERARLYAQLKDWDIVKVYHLEGVSGKSVIDHPETQQMLKDVRTGAIQALIFSKIARLARNTRELLDFADHFQKYNANIVSLQEDIDTSSPAGRFFYTLISAMAQWEREEISSRVKASVPIRARLGKSLGGATPYGYVREGGKYVLDQKEAPIRKRMFELFKEHQRKRRVAKILNDEGYRTRNNGMWSDTTIDRLLRDPLAKGMRRANYTESLGDNKAWKLKPESEWVYIQAPAIVSKELWQECNDILDTIRNSVTKVRRKSVHLFSGVLHCHCGTKMYMRSRSPVYHCTNCKNKINPEDLEEIFKGELDRFLLSDKEITRVLKSQNQKVNDKEKLVAQAEKDVEKIGNKIEKLLSLLQEDKLTNDAFEKYHTPLYEQLNQKEHYINTTRSEITFENTNTLSSHQIILDAKELSLHWDSFSLEDKKTIIHEITTSIIVGKDDIQINLAYLPTLTSSEKGIESLGFPTMSLLFKLVTLYNTTMPMWIL